jgi:hypothetical protein
MNVAPWASNDAAAGKFRPKGFLDDGQMRLDIQWRGNAKCAVDYRLGL